MRVKYLVALAFGLVAAISVAPVLNGQGKSKSAGQSASGADATVVTEIDAGRLKQLVHPGNQISRPLLINFWATWCDSCREEYPDLVKIDAKFKDRQFDFITVSLDDVQDIKTKVPEFLHEMHAPMPAYLLNTSDQEAAITSVDPDWKGSLPATFLLNAKGEIVYRHMGRINATELTSEIDKVTASK